MTTPTEASDVEDLVRSQFATIGIEPSEEELKQFAASYPAIRRMADLLHAVGEARYESPGLHFNPTPRSAPAWG